MKSDPLISVIVPAYNCERYISQAIDSVLDQSWQNLECLVIDDGSVDRTAEIVCGFGGKVKYVHQENAGASAARTKGIELAAGEYIAFLDSDDVWDPGKLAAQISIFQRHPDLALVCTDTFTVFEGSKAARSGLPPVSFDVAKVEIFSDFTNLFLEPYLCTSTVMVPTEIARAVGGFDEDLITAEDIDFYLNVCWQKSFARMRQQWILKNEVVGSLGDTPDTYHDNIFVIEKFTSNHPEFAEQHADVVAQQKSYIYRNWIEYLVYHGHGTAARVVLRECENFEGKATLHLKSYFCNLIARAKGRYRILNSRFK